MKKLLSVALASMMTLSLAACSGGAAQTTAAPAASEAAKTEAAPAAEEKKSDYPKYAVTFVTSKSGSAVDNNCRALTQHLSGKLGVNVVVTNTAGQNEALREVMNADNDGYTLWFGNTSPLINDAVGDSDFDVIESFDMVCAVSHASGAAIAMSSKRAEELGIADFQDLIDYCEAHPYELKISSQPNNSTGASVTGLIEDGLKVTTVNVGETGDRITAALSGNIDLSCTNYGAVQQYQESGDMIILMTTGSQKNPYAGETPCGGDFGFNTDYPTYYYIAAPKGTSDDVKQVIETAVQEILEMPEYQENLVNTAQIPSFQDHEGVLELLKEFKEKMSQHEVIGMF